jgi:hypothetical protein
MQVEAARALVPISMPNAFRLFQPTWSQYRDFLYLIYNDFAKIYDPPQI